MRWFIPLVFLLSALVSVGAIFPAPQAPVPQVVSLLPVDHGIGGGGAHDVKSSHFSKLEARLQAYARVATSA